MEGDADVARTAGDPAGIPADAPPEPLRRYATAVRDTVGAALPDAAGRLLEAGLLAADPYAPTLAALDDRTTRAAVPLAVGKAAVPMARAWQAWGGPPGILVGPRRAETTALVGWEVRWGEHPVPGATSYAAGRRMLDIVREGLDAVLLVSGGASAMVEQPAKGLAEEQHRPLAERLWRLGLPIAPLNAARSLLSSLKAGGLQAEAEAAGTRLEVLFASDVPGDDPALVASGPAMRVATEELVERVRTAGLPDDLQARVVEAGADRRTPAASAPHTRVLSRRAPVEAMAAAAEADGLAVQRVRVDGPVAEAAERVAEAARGLDEGAVLALWGEPVVRVPDDCVGEGRGGRTTHLLCSVWDRLAGGDRGRGGGGDRARFAMAVVATDGDDGAADAGGAWARFDPGRGEGLREALRRFDTAAWLEALPGDVGGLVPRHVPGANCADLGVVVRL